MLLLPTAYFAPVSLYALLWREGAAVEDCGERYLRQTLRTRCRIATSAGVQTLSLPVERTHGAERPLVRDLRLSEHGDWRRVHFTALRSAYERSPYFDYFADELAAIYADRRLVRLVDFNDALRRWALAALGMEADIALCRAETSPAAAPGDIDLRTRYDGLQPPVTPHGRAEACAAEGEVGGVRVRLAPYYQVFASRTGFLPDLSIADLIFHMGREARLVLAAACACREVG